MAHLGRIGPVALALCLIGACGGQTGSGSSGGAGGAGGSGAGAGGSSAGGSSAGGSSAGGAGGSVGGAGGSVGGSSGAGGSSGKTPDQLIVSVCAQAESLECYPPDCETSLYETWNEAYSAGCEPLFIDALECIETHGLFCLGGEVQVPPECAAAVDAMQSCVGAPGDCGGGGGNGVCSVDCSGPGGWGAICNEVAGGLSCQCTSGPNAGVGFSLPNMTCASSFMQDAEAWCT